MEHVLEGGDDSSSHIRSALTTMDLSIPIDNGQLSLWVPGRVFTYLNIARVVSKDRFSSAV
jgi:thiamine phosphate synthase YjbQ (UPF0047 family)